VDKAADYLKNGDEASAIVEYRRAVNANPQDIELRLKLIKLYIRRKMHAEAADELERARILNPNDEGLRTELASVYEEMGSPDRAAQIFTNQADQNPKDIAARLKAGDHYWQHGQLEQAEEQYRIAIKADPTAPAPHERLALVLTTQLLYNESRVELVQLQQLETNRDPATVATRYSRFRDMIDRDIDSLVKQLETATSWFENKETTREVCYDTIRGIGVRIDSICGFLQALNPPDSESSRHRGRILGCSLISQACSSTLLYLETNKTSEQDDAAIFLSEAKQQLAAK
jgi:tetratricopeptide (TPR) repeat protein